MALFLFQIYSLFRYLERSYLCICFIGHNIHFFSVLRCNFNVRGILFQDREHSVILFYLIKCKCIWLLVLSTVLLSSFHSFNWAVPVIGLGLISPTSYKYFNEDIFTISCYQMSVLLFCTRNMAIRLSHLHDLMWLQPQCYLPFPFMTVDLSMATQGQVQWCL